MDAASLTRSEAEERSRLLAVTRYDIDVDLTGLLEGDTFRAVSTITFTCSEPGASTFVDCVADDRAGRAQRPAARPGVGPRGPAAAGRPRRRQRAGGRHRAVRHRELQRHPAHRRPERRPGLRLDQLRARRGAPDVGVLRPARPQGAAPVRGATPRTTWTVTSNTGPETVSEAGDGARTWTFPDTPTLSTYVVVVNAGPFHEVRRQHDGYDLGFYCRQSLVAALERDLDDLVTVTRQGLAFFGEQFGVPFPQQRYDQVFVPDLGGAMENWGCVTYGDAQLSAHPAQPRAAGAARGVRAPRDGPHVVRRPGDHALVGRPVAQRGVRLVGLQLGALARHRVRRPVGGLPGALQARRLRHGHGAGPPPDPRRRARRRPRDRQLRLDHLRQGPERAPPADGLHRRGGVRRRAAGLLPRPRLGQHRPRRPDVGLRRGRRHRPDRLDGRLARPGRHRHAAARRRRDPRRVPRRRAAASPPAERGQLRRRGRDAGAGRDDRRTARRRGDPGRPPRSRPPPGQRRRQHLRGGPPRRGLAAHHARPARRAARAALPRPRRRHDQPAAAARRAGAARGRRGRGPGAAHRAQPRRWWSRS